MFHKIILRGAKSKSKSTLQLRISDNNYFHINCKKASFVDEQGFTSKFPMQFRCVVANVVDVHHPFTLTRNEFWRKDV